MRRGAGFDVPGTTVEVFKGLKDSTAFSTSTIVKVDTKRSFRTYITFLLNFLVRNLVDANQYKDRKVTLLSQSGRAMLRVCE